MISKNITLRALAHESRDKIPGGLGAILVTGIHVLAIERLRDYFGFESNPIRMIEPYQMLGEIDDELLAAFHFLCVYRNLISCILLRHAKMKWKKSGRK
jgi:hypothetical protein